MRGVLIIAVLLCACKDLGECPRELAECLSRPWQCPAPREESLRDAMRVCGRPRTLIDVTLPSSSARDLDVLFLIDNSSGPTEKQVALIESIPRFFEKLDAIGANYHVGIATSDIGSYRMPGQPWPVSLGSCNTFEGDDGALQWVACNTRTNVSADALAACNKLCPDPRFVPQGGRGFISRIGSTTNVPQKMAGGKDVGPIEAFKCIALVGDAGCGIEGQLEGARRALDSHNPINADFLRPNSVLAVIFITDEDDCSTSLKGRKENNPSLSPADYPPEERAAVMACDNPAGNPDPHYACYNPDYRCFARSTKCSQQLNQAGEKTDCVERPSYLEPVENYVKFFSALRPPSMLVIGGIWTPKDGKIVISQRGMSMRTQDLNRGEGVDAACVGNDTYCPMGTPGCFFARPQHRLSKFASQFLDSVEVSVCDVDKYPSALDRISDLIAAKLMGSCLDAVPLRSGDQPVCRVGDVAANQPNATPESSFPVCSKTCCDAWADAPEPNTAAPAIQAACAGEPSPACYCAVPSRAGACRPGVVAGIWRKGPPPAGTAINFRCAVE